MSNYTGEHPQGDKLYPLVESIFNKGQMQPGASEWTSFCSFKVDELLSDLQPQDGDGAVDAIKEFCAHGCTDNDCAPNKRNIDCGFGEYFKRIGEG